MVNEADSVGCANAWEETHLADKVIHHYAVIASKVLFT